MEDDSAWIRPLFPPAAVSRLPEILFYQGVRVVEIETHHNLQTNKQEYVVKLEGGRFVRLSRDDFSHLGLIPRNLMAKNPDDSAPKGLAFKRSEPAPTPPASSEPRGLSIPKRAEPARPSPDMASLVSRPQAPPPPPADMSALLRRNNTHDNPRDHASPAGLSIPARAVDMSSIVQRAPAPAKPPGSAVIGGDPRAPAMLAKAKEIDVAAANDRRFHNKLQQFLDLTAIAWSTWADADVRFLVSAASTQAASADKLRLANVVKWASECQEAYSKPPGFLDRLTQASRPEFYRVRLEQARDCLVQVQAECISLQTELKTRLATVRVDALVLQVATENEPEPSNKVIAQRRYQTLVQAQTTGAMILAAAEQLAMTCANQTATVGDLLNVTIPNWIMALKTR